MYRKKFTLEIYLIKINFLKAYKIFILMEIATGNFIDYIFLIIKCFKLK